MNALREDGLLKFPSTPHIEGSRLQKGDSKVRLPWAAVQGKRIVLEEKYDGSNCGISFTESQELRLQSRGHYLTGGGREKYFNVFKKWAECHRDKLFRVLGARYVMYGEWMFAKHAVFYDQLPHYFLEFDVFDRHASRFLTKQERRHLLVGVPVVSANVLYEGLAPQNITALEKRMVRSQYQSEHWQESLKRQVKRFDLKEDLAWNQTDTSGLMEGFYGKVEAEGEVLLRFKWVRNTFTQSILDAGDHWLKRPILPNLLADDVDIFEAG